MAGNDTNGLSDTGRIDCFLDGTVGCAGIDVPCHHRHQADLDGLDGLAFASRSGSSAVFHPVHPADIFHVGTILDMVLVCNGSRQFDLNGLHPLALAGRSTGCPVAHPAKPALSLHVRTVLDAGSGRESASLDLDGLHAQVLASRSASCSVAHPAKPALLVYMGLVGDAYACTWCRCCCLCCFCRGALLWGFSLCRFFFAFCVSFRLFGCCLLRVEAVDLFQVGLEIFQLFLGGVFFGVHVVQVLPDRCEVLAGAQFR